MKRQIFLAAAAIATVITAAGCAADGAPPSGVPESTYCESFADSRSAFQDMASGHIVSFEAAFAVFHDLAAQAPPAVSSQWATLDGAFGAFEKALDEAGMDVEQLDAVVSEGKVPEGVDVFEMQRLMGQMERFGSTEFAAAAGAIEKHGQDECGVDVSS